MIYEGKGAAISRSQRGHVTRVFTKMVNVRALRTTLRDSVCRAEMAARRLNV